MDLLEDNLYQIGFTKNEARVYLELLKIGPQAVSIVAKKSELNRTTTYSVLKTLEKKGLVAFYYKDSVGFFVANDPNCLVGYIDRKCRIFDYHRDQVVTMIPHFRDLIGEYSFRKPIVSYFEGVEGIKRVMYDALDSGGDCRAYLCLDKWFSAGLKDFLIDCKDTRIKMKKIQLKAIASDLPEIRAFFEDNYDLKDGLTEVLYMKQEIFPALFQNEINIYGNKVAILHLDRGSEYGVIIESPEIAEMHRAIFDMAYKGGELFAKENR